MPVSSKHAMSEARSLIGYKGTLLDVGPVNPATSQCRYVIYPLLRRQAMQVQRIT